MLGIDTQYAPKWERLRNTMSCRALLYRDEEAGGYTVVVRNLPGVTSEGDTIEEAIANIQDAFSEAILSYRGNGMDIPWGEEFELPEGVPEHEFHLMVRVDA